MLSFTESLDPNFKQLLLYELGDKILKANRMQRTWFACGLNQSSWKGK